MSEGRAGCRIKWPAADAMDGRRQLKRPDITTGSQQPLKEAMALGAQMKWALIATRPDRPQIGTNADRVRTPMASECYGVSAFPQSCESGGRTK